MVNLPGTVCCSRRLQRRLSDQNEVTRNWRGGSSQFDEQVAAIHLLIVVIDQQVLTRAQGTAVGRGKGIGLWGAVAVQINNKRLQAIIGRWGQINRT